jgi:uncharacterized protein YuzE
MSIAIGPYIFPVVHYDAAVDVLYLHKTAPDGAIDWDDTPEGHGVRFGPDGQVVGITLLHPRWLLEHEGRIKITLPVPESIEVHANTLSSALVAA